MHVWALGLSCETPAAPPDRAAGARTRQPENSKRAHLSAPALQTPPKFHEKTTREEEKSEFLRRNREKKARNFGLPTLRGPTLRGPTLRGPTLRGPTLQGPTLQGPTLRGPTLRGPTLRGPTFSGFEPPPFGAPPFGAPPFGAPPLRGPTLRGPTLQGPTLRGPTPSGPHPSGPTLRGPTPHPRGGDCCGVCCGVLLLLLGVRCGGGGLVLCLFGQPSA